MSTVSILGTGAFLFVQQFHFLDSFGSALSHAFFAAILLLGVFTVTIPSYKISFSADSAIYLAIVFLIGPNLALDILFLHSLIYLIWKNKLSWQKHIFNFASFTLIILFSYAVFIFFGGETGEIQTLKLAPYILALSAYFSLYMIFTIIPFFFSKNSDWITVLKQFIEDKTFIITYLATLLFSIAVGILISKEGVFGLFLFVCIAMMLSIAYIEYFKLFQEVSNKAKKDFLTGLYNHGSFKELLDQAVLNAQKTNKPLSLALIDLDDFKKYNDVHGHLQGDHLLSTFGQLIDSFSTEKKFISARYGGEEFAILMEGANSQEAYHFLNQVREKINDTPMKGVEVLPYGCLSFSAGIVELKKGNYGATELLNNADKAMYLSKAQGKNMVQIYQEKLEKTILLLEEEIEKAEQKLALFLAKDV